jgi:hypothetical protein
VCSASILGCVICFLPYNMIVLVYVIFVVAQVAHGKQLVACKLIISLTTIVNVNCQNLSLRFLKVTPDQN